jgi:hypothetical protein
MRFVRTLSIAALLVGGLLVRTAPAQVPPLGLSIDPTHGVPGQIVDGTVDTDDIAANCPADPAPLATAAYTAAYGMALDSTTFEEVWGPGCTDFFTCDINAECDTPEEMGWIILINVLLGVFIDFPPGTLDDAFDQTFALAFADVVTQAVQGTPGMFDKDTGLGTVEVPNIDPGLWAVAAACVLPLPVFGGDPFAPITEADRDRIREAVAIAGQLVEDSGLPIQFPVVLTDNPPGVLDFAIENGPAMLLPLMVPTALGVQLFTIDQTCSDAAECQDGDVCNGFEVCEFDETAETDICMASTE